MTVIRQAFRDPGLQAQFERDGFVAIPLLDEGEVDALKSAAAQLLPEKPPINDPQRTAYISYFDLELRERASDLIQSFVAQRLAAILEGYRPFYSTFFYKHAGAGEVPLHQHSPYVADFRETVINCWCPLVDCDETGGTLQLVPKSHQLLRHVQTPHTPQYWDAFLDRLRERHLSTIDTAAGHAILFEDSIPHGSTPNERPVSRLATLTTLIPEDATPAFFVGRGENANAYAAEHAYCYSDFFHDRLPPEQDWKLLATVDNAVERIDSSEFERRLVARGHVKGRSLLTRLMQRGTKC